jgi:hypothetical protein
MEAHNVADRTTLRALWRHYPDWPARAFAEQLGRSLSWVRKWLARFRAAPEDDALLWGRSRARHHPPPPVPAVVVERILEIRDQPPDQLQRTPGPKAILYYLHHRSADLPAAQVPRSTRTVWKILRAHGRMAPRKTRRQIAPLDRPAPLLSWQLDFKDASTVPPEPDGKQQPVVEILDVVDVGTSLLLSAVPAADDTAETVFAPLVATLRQYGLPTWVTCDRDARLVGSASGHDFPSPFVRFWQVLGVQVFICPPRRPERHAFVERFQGTLSRECLEISCPQTLAAVRAVTAPFQHHYNTERPNQARTCGNRPPAVAFPVLPRLPALPETVDPDRWLHVIHGRRYARTVKPNGNVEIDGRSYYVAQHLARQAVVLEVDAPTRTFQVWQRAQAVKRLPIKGLIQQLMAFEAFVHRLEQEACTVWRTSTRRRRLAG